MFQDNVLESDEPALEELESRQSVLGSLHEPNGESWKEEARVLLRQEVPAARQPVSPDPERRHPPPIGEQPRNSALRRRPIVSAIGAILLASALGGGYLYLDYAERFQSTDDAFIAARQFSLAPKVSGYLTAVPVTDNEHVAAGGVIARIDDRDYRIALEQAEAQVAAAQASIENISAQLNVQQYTSQLHQQQAALASAQATLKLAQRQVEALKAQRNSAIASLAQAQAQRDQAELNLSYTTVTAAQLGRVVNLSAAVGQFAQPGTSLTMFVPDEIWVTANFKEIQLDHMRPGEPVTLKIDAYPERTIRGHVDSVQPGSGTAFSLLPAQNATGNYVKIVQRVPVKIVIDDPPSDVALGPGMSVDPTVRVDPALSLLERLESVL